MAWRGYSSPYRGSSGPRRTAASPAFRADAITGLSGGQPDRGRWESDARLAGRGGNRVPKEAGASGELRAGQTRRGERSGFSRGLHLPPGRTEGAGLDLGGVCSLRGSPSSSSPPPGGIEGGQKAGPAPRPSPSPSPARRPRQPEGDRRHHPGAEKPVWPVPWSGGKRKAAEEGGADAGRGKARSHWELREPEEPPPTGHASRGHGPAPARHEELARLPALGPGGPRRRQRWAGAQRARGEACTRRMPQPGPIERQVRRSAAPGPLICPTRRTLRSPGGPGAADSRDPGCSGSSCPHPRASEPTWMEFGWRCRGFCGLGDVKTQLVGQAALTKARGVSPSGRRGESREVSEFFAPLLSTRPGFKTEYQTWQGLWVLEEGRWLPCNVWVPLEDPLGKILLGPPWELI